MNGPEAWPDSVWQDINTAILEEMGKVRVAQKVFPTDVFLDDPPSVVNEVVNFEDLSISEGLTKQYVEVSVTFPMTTTQVKNHAETKLGVTLSRLAAKAAALAEDTIFFQGASAPLPAHTTAERLEAAVPGLLGEAAPDDAANDNPARVSEPIEVPLLEGQPGLLYGAGIFEAVTRGISLFTRKAQAEPYALILPTDAYADTYVTPGEQSLVTTADRIRPLVEGGFYGTGTLPRDRGLLVALGGQPVKLCIGREAAAEHVRQEGSRHIFRIFERPQYVVRDPRSLILLRFELPT